MNAVNYSIIHIQQTVQGSINMRAETATREVVAKKLSNKKEA